MTLRKTTGSNNTFQPLPFTFLRGHFDSFIFPHGKQEGRKKPWFFDYTERGQREKLRLTVMRLLILLMQNSSNNPGPKTAFCPGTDSLFARMRSWTGKKHRARNAVLLIKVLHLAESSP